MPPVFLFGLGPAEISFLGILVAVLLAGSIRARGVALSGPTLVLQHFDLNPSTPDALLNLVGRPEGLVGWLLSVIGVDTTTTLSITKDYVHVDKSSLSGQFRQTAPMNNIASTHCGYSMNISLIVLAILALLGGLVDAVGRRSFWPFLIGLVIALLFVLGFFLSKKLLIAFETNGGTFLGVYFKKGIIENVPVDIEQLNKVITLFNEQFRRTPVSAAATARSSKPEQWYYAKDGKRVGPISADDLKKLITNGQLSPNDMLWKEGMASWMSVQQLKGVTQR